MKLNKIILMAVLLASTHTFAAQPSDESLKRWLEIQKFDENFEQSFNYGASITTKEVVANKIEALPQDKQKAITEAIERYNEKIKQAINTADNRARWKQNMMDSARLIFNQDEIDAMTAFYGSTVGQSVQKKMPQYITMVMPNMMQQMFLEADKVNKTYGEKFKQEIHQILCADSKKCHQTSMKQSSSGRLKHPDSNRKE